MTRTILTLEETDKKWLDRYSREHKQSTAETIREAIRAFRQKEREGGYRRVLDSTAGLLKGGPDAVEFVRRERKEWD